MNDFRDLKSIAEACEQHQPLRFMPSHGALYIRNDNGIVFDVHQNRSFPEFMAQNKDYADLVLAASPATVLALIAENERIKTRLCVCRDCGGQGEIYSGHDSYQGYNQPPEPDMDVCGTCCGDGVLGPLEDFEALAAERDQLKAENDRLRKLPTCWSEVLEQSEANDELLDKVLELGADAERYRWLRSQHWNESDMVVACHPKKSVKLGFDCPSGERLDHAIDAAMGKGEQA